MDLVRRYFLYLCRDNTQKLRPMQPHPMVSMSSNSLIKFSAQTSGRRRTLSDASGARPKFIVCLSLRERSWSWFRFPSSVRSRAGDCGLMSAWLGACMVASYPSSVCRVFSVAFDQTAAILERATHALLRRVYTLCAVEASAVTAAKHSTAIYNPQTQL